MELPGLEQQVQPDRSLPDSQAEVAKIVALYGGRTTDDPAKSTHALLRHRQQQSYKDLTLPARGNPKIVSLLWLLACIQEQALLEPSDWGSKVCQGAGDWQQFWIFVGMNY